jgi:SAM-dependent methyltransferase|tara:strand:+ start:1133 stop:1915 length:783 start_codon:yes stop_codon:yes gene_type:complete
MAKNYESIYWGYIYDQMMEQDCRDWLDENLAFYRSNLEGVSGRVLECACGTGLFLLPLLTDGYDIYGFDTADSMLTTLRNKADRQNITGISRRISNQDLDSFTYDLPFEAVIIPTNTFGMLTTQNAQIATLRNIYTHLTAGGRLLLDQRLAGIGDLAENAAGIQGSQHTWAHPQTDRPILQRIDDTRDLTNQLYLNRCTIEYDGEAEEFPMTGRWIFKDEFQLLLRLAGFERWDVWGTPIGEPLVMGLQETPSYWIAYKD